MNSDTTKPKILFVAAWWPRPEAPFEGLFILEHARALSAFANLDIIHLEISKTSVFQLPTISIKKSELYFGTQWMIHIYTPIRRFGIHDYLIRRAYNKVVNQIRKTKLIDALHINVRTHITRFVPFLKSTDDLNFVHTEHFSYYHRGIHLKPKKERVLDTHLIKIWMKDPRLKSIMPVSKELAQILIDQFEAPMAKVRVIPNIANEVFHYQPWFSADHIKIVSAANWQGPKKPLQLIEAVSRLSLELQQKIDLTIIGEGEYFPQMSAFANALNKQFVIHFTGFLTKVEMADHFHSAAFFAHPTSSENAPTVIAEALCCGLPVLSMSVNGIPEMVNETNGILVLPDDIQLLVNGLETMFEKLHQFNRSDIAADAAKKYGKEQVGKAIMNEINKAIGT